MQDYMRDQRKISENATKRKDLLFSLILSPCYPTDYIVAGPAIKLIFFVKNPVPRGTTRKISRKISQNIPVILADYEI
jgi:hypothetical protein